MERIDAIEGAGVDETPEQITDVGHMPARSTQVKPVAAESRQVPSNLARELLNIFNSLNWRMGWVMSTW